VIKPTTDNPVFHLRNARPLHSIAHIFKTTAPICIIFDVFQLKDNNSFYPYSKTKGGFLLPCLSSNVTKIDCTDIILLFNDMFHVSTVLLQNAFETTSSFTDA